MLRKAAFRAVRGWTGGRGAGAGCGGLLPAKLGGPCARVTSKAGLPAGIGAP